MWDPIMQVGRTPMITQDITSINPYSVSYEDISYLCTISSTMDTNMAEGGYLYNITNPNFDFNTFTAFQHSTSAAGQGYCSVTFDLGKIFYIKDINLYYVVTDNSGTGSFTNELQVSEDGVNYTTVDTRTETTASSNRQLKGQEVRARYVRSYNFLNNNGSGQAIMEYNRISIKVDFKQQQP